MHDGKEQLTDAFATEGAAGLGATMEDKKEKDDKPKFTRAATISSATVRSSNKKKEEKKRREKKEEKKKGWKEEGGWAARGYLDPALFAAYSHHPVASAAAQVQGRPDFDGKERAIRDP
jgi:hypothetical protein